MALLAASRFSQSPTRVCSDGVARREASGAELRYVAAARTEREMQFRADALVRVRAVPGVNCPLVTDLVDVDFAFPSWVNAGDAWAGYEPSALED
jgi:hypothetical protein